MKIRENIAYYAALAISATVLCGIAYKTAEQHGIQLGIDSVEKIELTEPGTTEL